MPDLWTISTRSCDNGATDPRLSYANVTERLFAEFGPSHGLTSVGDVVRSCRTGEAGVSTLISPELLEVLARERLRLLPAPVEEAGS